MSVPDYSKNAVLVPGRESVARRGRAARIVYACMVIGAVILLPAGVYFLFLFRRPGELAALLMNESMVTLIRVLGGVAIALGLAIIPWNALGPRGHRPARELWRWLPVAVIPLVFLAQVEVFGLWLSNVDPVFVWMNRHFVGAGHPVPGDGEQRLLSLSPDGNRLACVEFPADSPLIMSGQEQAVKPEHRWRLSVLDSSGRQIASINKKGALFRGFELAWAPDSTRIAGCYARGKTVFLWVFQVATQEFTSVRACEYVATLGLGPSWSPDGKTLALSVSVEGDIGVRAIGIDSSRILLWDASSLEQTQIIESNITGRWVRFTDDTHILYFSESQSEDRGSFWVVDTTTGKPFEVPLERNLFAALNTQYPPVLVRSGQWMLICLRAFRDASGRWRYRGYLCEIKTGKLELLTRPVPYSKHSPGTYIMGGTSDRDGARAFFTMISEDVLWPHSMTYGIFSWEEGSHEIKEYKHYLGVKGGPGISAAGTRLLFWWAGGWYLAEI